MEVFGVVVVEVEVVDVEVEVFGVVVVEVEVVVVCTIPGGFGQVQ